MKKLSFIFIIVLALSLTLNSFSYSQNTKSWEWVVNIVGTDKNQPYSLSTDKQGNTFVAGSFIDTLKVGNVQLISKGGFDIYILKFNTIGKLIWAKQAGGIDFDEAYGITSDESGFIYLTGYFSGTADFSGINITSSGDRDFFVAKYTTGGERVWVKQGGSELEDYGTAIATDNNSNVFITGIFKGTMNIENSKYFSKGDKDIFLIKYNKNGDIVWETTAGGNLTDESTALVIDKTGNCYLTGDFEGIAVFNKIIIVSAGKKDVFLAKYNSNGKTEWLKRSGFATGDDHASSIDIDNQENIYLTGYFSGIAYFGKTKLKNVKSDDIFLTKYNPNGDEIWAKQCGGIGDEHARALKLDKEGNIYITGEFNVDFTFANNTIKNMGDWDIFILKYNNSGKMLGGTQIGGPTFNKAYSIGLDELMNIYISGYFGKAITFGTTKLYSVDADDGFIAKLKHF